MSNQTRILIPLRRVLLMGFAAAAFGQHPEKVAEVNGQPILAGEVDSKLGANLAQLQQQIFTMRQKQLDSMIDQRLLEAEATRRRVTVGDLLEAEVTSRVAPVTSADAEKLYRDNAGKLDGDFKTLEPQLKTYLGAQRMQIRRQEFVKTLRTAANVSVFLKPPPVFRSQISLESTPVRGNAAAPVTIVEFSDFHCPFCRKAQASLNSVRAKYGDKVKFAFRDFPLDGLHPKARAAAAAAHCANEQGKFWEFYDRLFQESGSTDGANQRFAKELGMDVKKFEACTASGKYDGQILASVEEGVRLGVTATPTFFVNGRILVGAQPLEAFTKVIDEELALDSTAKGTQEQAGR